MEERPFYSVYDIHVMLGRSLSERQIRRYIAEGDYLQGATMPGGRKYLIPAERVHELLAKLREAARLKKKYEETTKQALLQLWDEIKK